MATSTITSSLPSPTPIVLASDVVFIYLVSSNLLNAISALASLAGMALYANLKLKKKSVTLPIKLGYYLLVADLVYHLSQIASNTNTSAGLVCSVGVWLWTFTTLLAICYTVEIAHNIHYNLISKTKVYKDYTKLYTYGPLVLSFVVSILPFFDSAYGLNTFYGSCWFAGPNGNNWQIGTMYIWIFVSFLYFAFVIAEIAIVFRKTRLVKEKSNSQPSTHKGTNATDIVLKKQFSVIKYLIPYPLILIISQFTLLLQAVYTSTDFTFNILVYNEPAVQGLLHFLVFLYNPQVFPSTISSREILDVVMDNPELYQAFYDFLKKLYCEENLDFLKEAQDYAQQLEINKPELAKSIASHIQQKFLKENTVNVPEGMLKRLNEAINGQSFTKSLFHETSEHLKHMLATDSVPKFIKTEKYKKLENNIRVGQAKKTLKMSEMN